MKTPAVPLCTTLLFIVPVTLILLVLVPLSTPQLGRADFIGYWSAARLLAQRQNPFDVAVLDKLQHTVNPLQSASLTVTTWNPPWLMALMIPYGVLPLPLATLLWMVTNVMLFGGIALLAWRFVALPGEGQGYVWVLAACFLFSESLMVIQIGQVSGLMAVSMFLALWALQARRDVLAGCVLLFAVIKPHITYLAVLILVIWAVRQRRWGLFGGLGGVAVASLVLTWLVYPGWPGDYLQTIRSLPYHGLYTSTLGSLMSALFGIEVFRYSALVLIPLIPKWVSLAERDLFTGVNLALLLSVPLSPYGFSFDQVVLLPAVAQLIYWLSHRQLPRRVAVLIGLGLAVVYGVNLWMMSLQGLPFYWMVWAPLALAGLFGWGWWSRTRVAVRGAEAAP